MSRMSSSSLSRADQVPDGTPPAHEAVGRRLAWGPYLTFVVLIAATVPWRAKSYFEGGLDLVVLAKAALSVAALGLAVLVGLGRTVRPLRSSPLVFLLLYLACTVLGAWTTGSLGPSLVIAVRVLLLGITILMLARSFDGTVLLGSFVVALVTVAVPAVVTGLGSIASGRLAGGLPPLHPNEIASTCALVVLWCLWTMSNGRDNWLHLVAVVTALGVIAATGSRTPLVAMVIASVLVIATTRAVRMRNLIVVVAAAPAVLWLLTATDLARNLLLRGEDPDKLNTLNSRTIAWRAAFGPKDSWWQAWFGSGLEAKRVAVEGQYWEQQILDSSWISALVQGGILGLMLCALWLLVGLISTRQSTKELRILQLALLTYLTLRGFLESGLFDASTAFLLFFVTLMSTPLRSATAAETLVPGQAPLELVDRRRLAWLT